MSALFSAFPPDRPAVAQVLDPEKPYRVGRGDDADLRIDHFSVSRAHAELRGADGRWNVHDLGSKNGLRVDGTLVLKAEFAKTAWFMIGDVYCSLEPMDSQAAAARRAVAQTRRETSRALSAALQPRLGVGTLLPQTLDVVLELSGMERGFVLYAPTGEDLRVRARRGIGSQDIARASFAGSIAAVDRALDGGRSVVCCDTDESPWLGARPSVRLGGIRALVCVPLSMPRLRGAVYADSSKPGPLVTELDLELIESVAQHATAALDAARLQDDVNRLMRDASALGVDAPRWDELRQRRYGNAGG
jgi:hypothetical protein